MRVVYWCKSQKEREPLERPRHRWVDNVKMVLREIERGGTDWIDLAEKRD
jgi:hypothetical protein